MLLRRFCHFQCQLQSEDFTLSPEEATELIAALGGPSSQMAGYRETLWWHWREHFMLLEIFCMPSWGVSVFIVHPGSLLLLAAAARSVSMM